MSADEFDPEIERLFSRAPHMADADLFATRIEARLETGSRFRTVALTSAGLIGGVFAVRESLNLSFTLSSAQSSGQSLTQGVGQGLEAAGTGANDMVRALVDGLGFSNLAFGSMGGMQLFWIATAALIAAAAVGVVKLSQEV